MARKITKQLRLLYLPSDAGVNTFSNTSVSSLNIATCGDISLLFVFYSFGYWLPIAVANPSLPKCANEIIQKVFYGILSGFYSFENLFAKQSAILSYAIPLDSWNNTPGHTGTYAQLGEPSEKRGIMLLEEVQDRSRVTRIWWHAWNGLWMAWAIHNSHKRHSKLYHIVAVALNQTFSNSSTDFGSWIYQWQTPSHSIVCCNPIAVQCTRYRDGWLAQTYWLSSVLLLAKWNNIHTHNNTALYISTSCNTAHRTM